MFFFYYYKNALEIILQSKYIACVLTILSNAMNFIMKLFEYL